MLRKSLVTRKYEPFQHMCIRLHMPYERNSTIILLNQTIVRVIFQMFSQKHKRATNSVCETEVDDRKEGKEKVKTFEKWF